MISNKVFNLVHTQQISLQNEVIRILRSIGLQVISVSQDPRMTIEIAPVRNQLHYAKLMSHSGIVSRRSGYNVEFSALVEQVRVIWRETIESEAAA
ncbi:hypothetical protein CAP31_03720 [Sulfuriferula sp. AH1]|uniref:hypothetical protein n=1 Tax=Sulfuriferula sp. AH1 TaxID=1985873 RepID=UPI000B3BAAE2|nr:hypothetical protein [Sulfuriferula sp. AH1]ARU30871.1 hypothetical protein CAP31_03720 [Sulfuriferula sp. AH1]